MTEEVLLGYTADEIYQPVLVLGIAVFAGVIAFAEGETVLYAGLITGIGLVLFAGILNWYQSNQQGSD